MGRKPASSSSLSALRLLPLLLLACAAGVYMQLSSIFPFLLPAEASLNVHPCVADYMVSSLRDMIYVGYDQLLPEKVVFPVCDSISGPACPHLSFPVLLEDRPSGSSKSSPAGDPSGAPEGAPDAYAAYLHRPLVWSDAGVGEGGGPEGPGGGASGGGSPAGGPLIAPLDRNFTFLRGEPLTAAKAQRHKVEEPYVNRGVYLEDGVGDLAAQSLSDALSNAIGHLGALTHARGVWAPADSPAVEGFLCFYTRDPQDRRDCHNLKGFSSLPSKYTAEVVAHHSGWRGASHLLTFDRSRAPFLSPYLERDYSFGLPAADTRWRGRWRVLGMEPSPPSGGPPPTPAAGMPPLQALPVAGPLAEGLGPRPASYEWLLQRKGPPQPLHTYARLDSQEGSFFHSSVFVAHGVWVAASPRVPSPTCSQETREASSKLVLLVQGLQDREAVFQAEVPLQQLVGLHAADTEAPPPPFRFVNALDFLKTSPLQRIDTLRFSYGLQGPRGGPPAPLTFDKPLQCSGLHAVLGALHLLVAEKTLSNKVYYAVDATTQEGRLLKEKAAAAAKQQQQQQARKEALAAKRAPLLQQLLGGPPPKPWRPLKVGPPPMLTAEAFEGWESPSQREGASYVGVLLRTQRDADPLLLDSEQGPPSPELPLSWSENHRIKFGRYDAMPNQFADLRRPLKTAAHFLQDLPAEAPVLSLNQLQQNKQVFWRKPVFESHGRFTSLQVDGGGIGDLRSLITSILKTLGGSKTSATATSSAAPARTPAKEEGAPLKGAPPSSPAAAAKPAAAADAAAAAPSAAQAVLEPHTSPSAGQEGEMPMVAKSLELLTDASPSLKDFFDRMAARVMDVTEEAAAASEGGPPGQAGGDPSHHPENLAAGESPPESAARRQVVEEEEEEEEAETESKEKEAAEKEEGEKETKEEKARKEKQRAAENSGVPMEEGAPQKQGAPEKQGVPLDEKPSKPSDLTPPAAQKGMPKQQGAPQKQGAPERPKKKHAGEGAKRAEEGKPAEIQAVLIVGPDGQMIDVGGGNGLPLSGTPLLSNQLVGGPCFSGWPPSC
ncbi:hypothetical protein Efla_007497 [Eimeria flavescens]